ncbi:MAG: hypothetical protein AAF196_17250 [Planctomycetota bacterium]
MNKLSTLLLATSLSLFATACQTTTSGNVADGDQKGRATAGASAVADAAAARRMARWARDNGKPVALASAASALASVGASDESLTKVEGGEGEAGDKAGGRGAATPESLFAEARQMAGNNETMLAAIGAMESTASRGAVSGPISHVDRVLAQTVDVYRIEFRGDEFARVVVDGDGDTDLDLYIFDENGNLITSDTDLTDYCVCSWTPRWTGTFRIEIRNLGGVYNEYTLTTN